GSAPGARTMPPVFVLWPERRFMMTTESIRAAELDRKKEATSCSRINRISNPPEEFIFCNRFGGNSDNRVFNSSVGLIQSKAVQVQKGKHGGRRGALIAINKWMIRGEEICVRRGFRCKTR